MTAEKFWTLLLSGLVSVGLLWAVVHKSSREQQPVAPTPDQPAPGPAPLRWQAETYEEALRLAADLKRPALIDVGAKWCLPCRRLEASLANPKVTAVLAQRYVLCKIDGESRKDVCKLYSVTGFPTLLIVDSAGAVAKRKSGYQSPGELAAWLQ